jgi:hypothetical protein
MSAMPRKRKLLQVISRSATNFAHLLLAADLPRRGANQFDRFAPIHLARWPSTAPDRLRLKGTFLNGFKPISRVPPRQEGRSRSSRNVARDAVDVEVPLTSGVKADGEIVWS